MTVFCGASSFWFFFAMRARMQTEAVLTEILNRIDPHPNPPPKLVRGRESEQIRSL